ncbi:glycerol kinase [Candidatus Gracilibacteria bacterium]|nr:glycerol kinase [Candidatus Gracilibacteria bacterium]
MEKISTTSLAKSKNMQPAELFELLQSLGYIVRENSIWRITEQGKTVGGEIQRSEKYGQYIIWPTTLDISKQSKVYHKNKGKQLNATVIGEYFKTSSQRLNLVLSELGLIEKDITGWRITKLGKNIGGSEHRHDVSGAYFVLWPENVLNYPRLLEVFKHDKLEPIEDKKVESQNSNIKISDNFREKFEAKHRTQDGHYVRSKAEMIIDNLLYQYGIIHAYERKLPIEEDVYSDFYIPAGNGRPQGVYIEYWGFENDEKYLERKRKKIEIYKENELALIELNEGDIQNLDDILPRKLLNFKIKVY